jgi:hypothetical protein
MFQAQPFPRLCISKLNVHEKSQELKGGSEKFQDPLQLLVA